MRRFTKDYELVTTTDGKGRGKTSMVYIGSYYNLDIEAAAYRTYRWLAWALLIGMVIFQIAAGFVNNRGMYQMYVAVPYVLCFFPLVYLSAGALKLPSATTHLRRDQAELSLGRMKKSGTALAVLNGLVVLAELAYLLLFGTAAELQRELVFLALMVLVCAANTLLLLKTRAIHVNIT